MFKKKLRNTGKPFARQDSKQVPPSSGGSTGNTISSGQPMVGDGDGDECSPSSKFPPKKKY